jgi:hypothetical protein
MWTEGKIDMTKLILAFRNFAKAPIKTLTMFYYSAVNQICHFVEQNLECSVQKSQL